MEVGERMRYGALVAVALSSLASASEALPPSTMPVADPDVVEEVIIIRKARQPDSPQTVIVAGAQGAASATAAGTERVIIVGGPSSTEKPLGHESMLVPPEERERRLRMCWYARDWSEDERRVWLYDRRQVMVDSDSGLVPLYVTPVYTCLLYTSDAADDM
jgi:hypothetical protein